MALDVHTDDVVVDALVLGKTDRAPVEPLEVRAEVEVAPLDLPRVGLADDVLVGRMQQALIGPPVVRVAAPQGQVRHVAQQAQQHLVLPPAVLPGHDASAVAFQ